MPSCSTLTTFAGMMRKTAAHPLCSRITLQRKRPVPEMSYAKSVSLELSNSPRLRSGMIDLTSPSSSRAWSTALSGEPHHLAIDAHDRRLADAQVQVRRPALDHRAQHPFDAITLGARRRRADVRVLLFHRTAGADACAGVAVRLPLPSSALTLAPARLRAAPRRAPSPAHQKRHLRRVGKRRVRRRNPEPCARCREQAPASNPSSCASLKAVFVIARGVPVHVERRGHVASRA